MSSWWLRPTIRILAALALPVLVPAIITLLIWALPGDPASLICPAESCGSTEVLSARWNLDRGPMGFLQAWLGAALEGDFGRSWRLQQGVMVRELLEDALPNTVLLMAVALLPVGLGSLRAAMGPLPRGVQPVLQVLGLIPALVLALVAAALVELRFGAASFGGAGALARLLAGGLVLGLADGALSGVVGGTRALFEAEARQRYVGVALLRGEGVLANTLPNVAPALVGQLRGRVLHLLSGAVVVEAVLRIDGIGDLLWGGTLLQDFGVVLATATFFALGSSLLLVLQAVAEIAVAMVVRRAPAGLSGGEA